MGSDNDCRIHHDGSNFSITEATGDVTISAADDIFLKPPEKIIGDLIQDKRWDYAKNFSVLEGDKIIDADKLNVPDIDFDDEGNIVKSNFIRLFGNKAGPSTKHMNIHKNLHSSPLDLTTTDEELEEIFSALEDVLGDG